MRAAAVRAVALAGLAVLVATAPVLGQTSPTPASPQPNGASIDRVTWTPDPPHYDEAVILQVFLKAGIEFDNLTNVWVTYCRVESYACHERFPLSGSSLGWGGILFWDEDFMKDPVAHVGFNLTLEHKSGAREASPRADWPARPPGVPAGAAPSYYYALVHYTPPPELEGKRSPGASVPVAIAALALVLARLRRP